MVIQYSSIPLSPLAHVRTTLHKRLSLFTSGHGRAYASFCSNKERQHLWPLALDARLPKRQRIPTASEWNRLVAETRKRGYSIRSNDVDPETRTIAVPIMPEPGRVVATLGMTCFRRVVQEDQFAHYAADLRASAAAASEKIRQELARPPLPANVAAAHSD
jgi:IclR family mhp operon transcriptional activator